MKLINFQNSEPEVLIYPDPADKYFKVKTDLQGFSLEITDANGKTIRAMHLINTNRTVDVSNLPSGLYNIRINLKNKITNTLLIIKH